MILSKSILLVAPCLGMFTIIWFTLGPSTNGLVVFLYVLVFTSISQHDAFHKEIPNQVIIPCIGLSYIGGAILLQNGLIECLIGASISFGLFFLMWIAPKSTLGAGDVKLAVAIGAICGVPNIITALFISLGLLIPAVIGIFFIRFINNEQSLKSESRFGATFGMAPFLSAGGFIALVWGEPIVNWYISLPS